MGTNDHARNRDASGNTTPPAGRNEHSDATHALRAGKDGPTQRRSSVEREPSTRDEGRDDRRSGSDSNRS